MRHSNKHNFHVEYAAHFRYTEDDNVKNNLLEKHLILKIKTLWFIL